MLDPPEGDAEAEHRHEDTQTHDPSAPTEESLGASQTGAEPSHDKSPVDPEHAEPQNQQSQDIVMQDDEPDQQQKTAPPQEQ